MKKDSLAIAANKWYTVDQAATLFGVRAATIRDWLKDGYLEGSKRTYGYGRRERWMISGKEIARLLREHRQS